MHNITHLRPDQIHDAVVSVTWNKDVYYLNCEGSYLDN